MAYEIANDRETPDCALLTSYEVQRLGKHARIRLGHGEVMHQVAGPYPVTATEDRDSDGMTDALTVEALLDETVVGVEVQLGDGPVVGTVASVEIVAPEVPGDPYHSVLVLSAGTALDLSTAAVQWRERMDVGTPAYRLARGGRQWELRLDTSVPDAGALVEQMLGAALYDAGAKILTEMGIAFDPAALQAAVATLGARGENLDGILATQAEQMELQRRAGAYPWMQTIGDAPRVGG